MNRQRGAALIETALALPVILLAVYGVTWGVRAGTVLERSETAVRYAGVVSAQQNPWHDYSLYALYNNLGTESKVETSLCSAPTKLYLSGGQLPAAIPGTQTKRRQMPLFWVPDSAATGCAQTNERQFFNGASRSYLLLQSSPEVATLVSDGGFFPSSTLNSTSTTGYRFYRSPDLATLMHCAGTLSSTVSSSLAPFTYGANPGAAGPLAIRDFTASPITLSPSCTTGIGTTPPLPAPSVPPYSGGNQSSPSPGPGGGGASPSPSPSPTKAPTPTPSPSPSSTPQSSPTPGTTPVPNPTGSGSGGGGGAPPTPSPVPGPGKSATPVPAGSPTGKPTGSPPTPTPSKPAATPTPSPKPTPATTPTATPTVKPKPSPAPTGPPGGVS